FKNKRNHLEIYVVNQYDEIRSGVKERISVGYKMMQIHKELENVKI
ncbi:30730_t:CDS:1, partial [Gigaspora margarita]